MKISGDTAATIPVAERSPLALSVDYMSAYDKNEDGWVELDKETRREDLATGFDATKLFDTAANLGGVGDVRLGDVLRLVQTYDRPVGTSGAGDNVFDSVEAAHFEREFGEVVVGKG